MNKQKLYKFLKNGVKVAGFLATVLGASYIAIRSQNTDSNELSPEDEADNYPICDCGAEMTDFDGCSWYTCPECGNEIRSNDDGSWTWAYEIFTPGSRELHSDFELADFCRGGDLTED